MQSNFKEQLYFLLIHKWKYLWAMFVANINRLEPKKVKDVVFIAREKDKEWIFGAKVRRLSRYSALNATTHYHDKLKNLPDADGYFFIYQNYFCRCIRSKPSILNKKNIVMFTHPNWDKKYSKTHVVWCLNKADYIICLNSEKKKYLTKIGVKPELLKVLHIGTSSKFFYSHERGRGDVGLCSSFHARKNPKLIYDIVKHMPERTFHLIGQNWDNYDRFQDIKSLPNFTYHKEISYQNYPEMYSKIDVFLSPSLLEGGPVPVLEAMMSNCVPVASKTGYCTDLISHGENGFLFDVDANFEEVLPLIEKAFKLKANIRETVMPYTWKNCAKTIDKLFIS